MAPGWLNTLAIASLARAFASAAIIVIDLFRRPLRMTIMNPVWPVTALYLGPLGF